MARRVPEYEKRRNIRIGFWVAFAVLCTVAWDAGKFSYWGLPLMSWGLYELLLVPTQCRARTKRNGLCTWPCYGLLKGCRRWPSHGPGKRADLLRTVTGGRLRAVPSQVARTVAFQNQPAPDSDAVTVEPAQRLVTVFTIVGGIAGVVQTVLTVLPMI